MVNNYKIYSLATSESFTSNYNKILQNAAFITLRCYKLAFHLKKNQRIVPKLRKLTTKQEQVAITKKPSRGCNPGVRWSFEKNQWSYRFLSEDFRLSALTKLIGVIDWG